MFQELTILVILGKALYAALVDHKKDRGDIYNFKEQI